MSPALDMSSGGLTLMSLEDDFAAECRRTIDECRTFRYSPTAWVAMIDRAGAVEAARRLVESGEIQSGFARLVREGRLDLTIEMAVLHPRWDSLFDRGVREAAWWRLAQAMASP